MAKGADTSTAEERVNLFSSRRGRNWLLSQSREQITSQLANSLTNLPHSPSPASTSNNSLTECFTLMSSGEDAGINRKQKYSGGMIWYSEGLTTQCPAAHTQHFFLTQVQFQSLTFETTMVEGYFFTSFNQNLWKTCCYLNGKSMEVYETTKCLPFPSLINPSIQLTSLCLMFFFLFFWRWRAGRLVYVVLFLNLVHLLRVSMSCSLHLLLFFVLPYSHSFGITLVLLMNKNFILSNAYSGMALSVSYRSQSEPNSSRVTVTTSCECNQEYRIMS